MCLWKVLLIGAAGTVAVSSFGYFLGNYSPSLLGSSRRYIYIFHPAYICHHSEARGGISPDRGSPIT